MPSNRADPAALRALSAQEWLVLVGACVAVPVAHALLRTVGYQRTRAIGMRCSPRRRAAAEGADRARRTTRVVWAVDQRLPGARTCLSRSLALWYLLRLQGVPADLRLGVRAGAATIDAHAWVEHEGRPLNDDEGVAHRYAPLDRPVDPDR